MKLRHGRENARAREYRRSRREQEGRDDPN